MKPILGIIGGMGTPAGLRIAKNLVDICASGNAVSDEDFAPFILSSIPGSLLDSTGVKKGGETGLALALAYHARRLNDAGCSHLIIACNSAHEFLPEVQAVFRGTVLDMVDMACSKACAAGDPVGLLSSRTTKDSGLFTDKLKSHKINVFETSDEEQAVIDSVIAAGIVGCQDQVHFNDLAKVIGAMENRGAITIILGCTELPLFMPEYEPRALLIDPGMVAAERFFEIWTNTSS